MKTMKQATLDKQSREGRIEVVETTSGHALIRRLSGKTEWVAVEG